MNSVKINNKNNLSKKLRKQQTPKPEQLKRNGKKSKNISEFSWQEKKIPSVGINGTWPTWCAVWTAPSLHYQGQGSNWTWRAGWLIACDLSLLAFTDLARAFFPLLPVLWGTVEIVTGCRDSREKLLRQNNKHPQGPVEARHQHPALPTMPSDKKAFNKHNASPSLFLIGFF